MLNKITQHQPEYEQGIFEFQEIARVENNELTAMKTQKIKVLDNQFVLTADKDGLLMFENLYGIIAKNTDTINFRHERILSRMQSESVYTERFLRMQLDNLIGEGLYTLDFDYNAYTITLNSAAESQSYAQEVALLVSKIKPANMLFINTPLLVNTIFGFEVITQSPLTLNYKLGTSWNLGRKPFSSRGNEETIKMAGVSSIQANLLEETASYISSIISKVVINGSVEITQFVTKQAVGGTVEIEYTIDSTMGLNNVTRLQLCKSDGTVLTDVTVYVPVAGETLVNHKLNIVEGGGN